MSSKKLIWLLFGTLFSLMGCNRPPQADFYEADGIISIHAYSDDPGQFWDSDPEGPTSAIVSKSIKESTAGETTFSFYISNPGIYAFWMLGNAETEVNKPIQLRFLNEQNETISAHRVELRSGKIPGWLNIDQFTEEPVVLQAIEKGFYTLQLESGGVGDLRVSKFHFSKNGDVIPEGAGFPETTDWRMEPSVEKRLEQAKIPPAWVFGTILNYNLFFPDAILYDENHDSESSIQPETKTGSYFGDESRGEDFRFYRNSESIEQSDTNATDLRSFNLYPAENLLDSNHKDNPVPWYRQSGDSGFEALSESVHLLSNPDLVSYESPWLLVLPDWYDSANRVEQNVSDELLIRTIQLSAFQNLMFVPFRTADVSDDVKDQLQRFMNLRRQLFPYIYSYTNRARTVGAKLITGDRNHPDQFLFGEYFLAAPVNEEGARNRELYLPGGSWYHYDTEKLFEGDQQINVEAPLTSIPIFVKAGAIIPKRSDGGDPILTEDYKELILDVYGGDSGNFRLYEDDGESLGYLSGEFSTIAYRYFEGDGYATFNIGAQVNDFPGRREQTEYLIRFKFVDEPEQLTANGEVIPKGEDDWTYDTEQQILVLKWIQTDSDRTEFRIEF